MKLYPEIILTCSKNERTTRTVGGVKFYFVAKHYDREGGSGIIHEKDFRAYAMRYLGISRATYYRWKKQAKKLGLFTDHAGILQLISWGRAALACGCERVNTSVEVSIREFVCNEGLSEVWAGYVKQFEPKPASDKAPAQQERPITKTTLRTLSGIPESTQRYYEAKAGVKKNPNIAFLGPGSLDAPSHEGGGYYAKDGFHFQRLGNTYHAPKRIKLNKRGRTDKVNRTIRATLSPFLPGSDQPKRSIKLYFQPALRTLSREAVEHERNRRIAAIQNAAENGEPEPTFGPYQLYARVPADRALKRHARKLEGVPPAERPNYLYAYQSNDLGVGVWVAWDAKTGAAAC